MLLYGHFDKNPPKVSEWTVTTPYNPKATNTKIFGRGTSTAGWSLYTFLGIVKALQNLKLPYPEMTFVVETQKESGSNNLSTYLLYLKDIIGKIDYCFSLNASCFDYENLYVTTSYKGEIQSDITVAVLE